MRYDLWYNANIFWRVCLPYCLKKAEDGSYIPLNRYYKPLGFHTQDFLRYEDYPVFLRMRLTERRLKRISVSIHEDGTFYLYNDATSPARSRKCMMAYMEKLAILAKYQVWPVEQNTNET